MVTPTGASKFLLKPTDLVTVDLEGRLLSGTRRVTSEIGMHLTIYELRKDVEAVIHSHPPMATAFACAGRGLDEVLCQEAVMTLGVVPLAGYATTGTPEVGTSIAPYVSAHDAILLANHGAVTYGVTLHDAFQKMETLEHLAQVALVAHQLGSAMPLSSGQMNDLHVARTRYKENAPATREPRLVPKANAEYDD